MALTSALYSTLSGIQLTENRINQIASNITNADKPGYTRKEIETSYTSVNGMTVALTSSIETVNYNPYLLETLIEDTSIANRESVISEYLTSYIRELGSIDGNNSVSSYMDNLITSFDRLTVTPEDASLKNLVSSSADRLAIELNRLSKSIQDSRLIIDQEIEATVDSINTAIAKVVELNKSIAQTESTGRSAASIEDERRNALEDLSKLININYFINDDNQVQIYTAGRPLLDSRAHEIEYTANTAIDKNTVYPAGFSGLDLDGFDITPLVKGGELSGLINLRDSKFVEEQAKLDEFASVLITQLNTLANSGASVPAPASVLSEVKGLTAATVLTATGSVRIATTDADGIVQNFADINLAALANIGDLVTAINTALGPDVTASIFGPDNQLQIIANNAGEGISMNQLNSSIAPDNESFAQTFGLNNIFDGSGADDISLSQYLRTNSESIPTSTLNGGALAIGDIGIFIGDASLVSTMTDAFNTKLPFNAAGNFSTQTESISNYINKIISDAAYRADTAKGNADITISLMQQTKTTMQNISAVNIDEEMANLIDLEAKYEASATMIATIQELFDALLNAVR